MTGGDMRRTRLTRSVQQALCSQIGIRLSQLSHNVFYTRFFFVSFLLRIKNCFHVASLIFTAAAATVASERNSERIALRSLATVS